MQISGRKYQKIIFKVDPSNNLALRCIRDMHSLYVIIGVPDFIFVIVCQSGFTALAKNHQIEFEYTWGNKTSLSGIDTDHLIIILALPKSRNKIGSKRYKLCCLKILFLLL